MRPQSPRAATSRQRPSGGVRGRASLVSRIIYASCGRLPTGSRSVDDRSFETWQVYTARRSTVNKRAASSLRTPLRTPLGSHLPSHLRSHLPPLVRASLFPLPDPTTDTSPRACAPQAHVKPAHILVQRELTSCRCHTSSLWMAPYWAYCRRSRTLKSRLHVRCLVLGSPMPPNT